jgi:hypothetical protein
MREWEKDQGQAVETNPQTPQTLPTLQATADSQIPANGRGNEAHATLTTNTRHEVPAPRAAGPSGRTHRSRRSRQRNRHSLRVHLVAFHPELRQLRYPKQLRPQNILMPRRRSPQGLRRGARHPRSRHTATRSSSPKGRTMMT